MAENEDNTLISKEEFEKILEDARKDNEVRVSAYGHYDDK